MGRVESSVTMQPSVPETIAVVLAGGDSKDPMAEAAGVGSKALVPFAGRPMAVHVVEALLAASAISHIVYVGAELERLGMKGPTQAVSAVQPGDRFAASLARGVEAALSRSPKASLLVVTADIPWLSGAAVDRFVRAAGSSDLAYPIVPEGIARAQFPAQERTFVRLTQGRFTGGNVLLLKPRLVQPLLELADRFYRARKNPFAMAALLGPLTLLDLMLGRADLERLERLVSRRLGGVARAVVSEDACLAADIDRSEHLPEGEEGEV